jgi:hypothetical protein
MKAPPGTRVNTNVVDYGLSTRVERVNTVYLEPLACGDEIGREVGVSRNPEDLDLDGVLDLFPGGWQGGNVGSVGTETDGTEKGNNNLDDQ